MTNKEAIEHLYELKTLRIEFPNALQEEALDMAIMFLEKEDLTKNQAYDKGFITAMNLYARPTGHWITWEEAGNDIASPNRHECSCCHDSAQVLVNGIELLSDFCPNCGADMRGKKV